MRIIQKSAPFLAAILITACDAVEEADEAGTLTPQAGQINGRAPLPNLADIPATATRYFENQRDFLISSGYPSISEFLADASPDFSGAVTSGRSGNATMDGTIRFGIGNNQTIEGDVQVVADFETTSINGVTGNYALFEGVASANPRVIETYSGEIRIDRSSLDGDTLATFGSGIRGGVSNNLGGAFSIDAEIAGFLVELERTDKLGVVGILDGNALVLHREFGPISVPVSNNGAFLAAE